MLDVKEPQERISRFQTIKKGLNTDPDIAKLAERYECNFKRLRCLSGAAVNLSSTTQRRSSDIKFFDGEDTAEPMSPDFVIDDKNLPPEGFPISDVYSLIKKIGEGGSGRVYLAEDNYLGIKCAIKILTSSLLKQKERRKQFYAEIKTTAKLRHPNIVSIFYANRLGEYPYYVMEYINGKNLAEIANQRTLSEEEVISKVALPLAQVLMYAHQAEVIHRDIKPGNLMLDDKGTLKLLDLGLAISSNLYERQGKREIVGTPFYIAPEQAQGNLEEVDQRTDIYSYGATIYHLLTGIPPFQGKGVYETLSMVIDRGLRPKNPREIRRGLSEGASSFILKCLSKEPDERYQNMQEVLTALKGLEEIK